VLSPAVTRSSTTSKANGSTSAATWDTALAAGAAKTVVASAVGVAIGAAAKMLKHIMFVGQLPYDATVPMIVKHFEMCAPGQKIKVCCLVHI